MTISEDFPLKVSKKMHDRSDHVHYFLYRFAQIHSADYWLLLSEISWNDS